MVIAYSLLSSAAEFSYAEELGEDSGVLHRIRDPVPGPSNERR